ncbi:MAG TPA: tetratricopeptide repeat protein [Kofleriaceae bacterium]|nr:tetratricopeptide repeat protein [Kofleriaceae bacterium]
MSQSDFVSRGQALVAAGQFQEAVKVCRLGLLGRPTTVEGRVVLGQALLALKRYDEVLAEMRVALELDQGAVPAHVLKGEALMRKGDTAAAIETLHKALQVAPGDPKIMQLLGQAEQVSARGPLASAVHPSVEFVGSGDTKHYPNHGAAEGEGDEDSGGGYTKPTTLAAPGSGRRSAQRGAVSEPSPAELAVGDKSGTVEVDPSVEGVEVDEDDVDFDDLAAPPVAGKKPAKIGGARGAVSSSARGGETVLGKKAGKDGGRKSPTIELDGSDDDLELGETIPPTMRPAPKRKLPAPNPAVRDAVGLPAGPLEGPARTKPASKPPRPGPSSPPPPAPSAPPPVAAPATPAPLPPVPRLAAGLPTMAAAPPPQVPPGVSPASVAAAARPTIAVQPPLTPMQQQSAAAVDALFGGAQPGGPAWAHATIAAQAGIVPPVVEPPPVVEQPALDPSSVPRTGMRKTRSKLQIAVWVVIGVIVIGGGVFAGFQIRAMRLQKQIAAARDRATDLSKADTWTAWSAAASNLGQIVGADDAIENRAAFARARALVAFEFADGEPEAKAAVDALAGQGGADGAIAAAYLALAASDVAGAKTAADAALAAAPDDPGAQYVAGRAALLGGDVKAAITYMTSAFEKDPRPLYGVGLARAHAAATAWDDAASVLDRVLGAHQDHPAATIERAIVLARSGRVAPGLALGMELHSKVQAVIVEGSKPAGEQPRGIAPAELAFANLALAEVDFARGDVTSARGDLRSAAAVGFDDARFAEDALDTLYTVNELAIAHAAAQRALASWPQSIRAHYALARILLAEGKPTEANDALARPPVLVALPVGLALRGQSRLDLGDNDGARADFEAALKKLPKLEPAIVGRARLELAAGDVDDAKKQLAPFVPGSGLPSPAIAIAYAMALRVAGDASSLDKAKQLLDKLVAGPPGIEAARAQLELARLDRDLGDFKGARAAYAEAAKSGNVEARLEVGLLMIEDRDAAGGREAIEALYKEQDEHASPNLLLELARARMLGGDHAGAIKLLDAVDAMAMAPKWKIARERGRLALRKGDYAGAVTLFTRALDGSGNDPETFLLAADSVTGDAKAGAALTEKLKKLAPERLKDQPEASIVSGKLAIAAGKNEDAIKAFDAARDALVAAKASLRRQAQAHFGLGAARYLNGDEVGADHELELVLEQDPSLYSAYLFRAAMLQDKRRKNAFELARKAVELDPDSIEGWALAGQIASKLGDRKVFNEALAKLSAIAPTSDEYKQLAALKH